MNQCAVCATAFCSFAFLLLQSEFAPKAKLPRNTHVATLHKAVCDIFKRYTISIYATHTLAQRNNNIYSLFDMLNDNLLHCCTNNIQFTINIKIEFDVAYAAAAAAAHTQRNKHCQQIGFCLTRKDNAENRFMGRKAKSV